MTATIARTERRFAILNAIATKPIAQITKPIKQRKRRI